MRMPSRLALAVVLAVGSGCASHYPARQVSRPNPPPMIGQAKTGAERVRFDQMHMMAAEDRTGHR